MTTIRIYDLKEHVLAVCLGDLLRLMAPQVLYATWIVSTVKSSKPGHEWFEATAPGGEQLEALAHNNARLSGSDLVALADNTQQIIWGEFTGLSATQSDEVWVIVRAVDSSFYEIETDDQTVLSNISSIYKDIRLGEVPVTSW